MTNHFQTIVVGGGSIGSAAAYWLAQHGQRDTLVLEQYPLAHDYGSHGDHSRAIRHTHHREMYARLTHDMFDRWARVDSESAQNVYIRTGGLDIARAGTAGAGSQYAIRSLMEQNGVAFEHLDKSEMLARYPQWHIEDDVFATYQPDAGIIDIRRATLTHLSLARGYGASIRDNTGVRAIESFDRGVRITTDHDTFTADHVIVSTGSWADELLKPLGQTWSTTITEEQVIYVQTPHLKEFSVGQFPIWGWHGWGQGEDLVYGFPTYGEPAVKIARENLRRVVTQEGRSPVASREENDLMLQFFAEHLPDAVGPVLYAKTCPYDLTPDRDFVLDFLPGHPRIVVGLGAGHAGKFAAVIGDILAQLVVDGASRLPIADFRINRPALTDPNYSPFFALRAE